MALECIRSLLAQTHRDLEIVVSENSTKDPLTLADLPQDERLRLVHRTPNLSSENHFRAMFSEATGPFMMVIHDDDLLHPTAVARLLSALTAAPTAAAVSPNAFFLMQDVPTNLLINPTLRQTRIFDSKDEFLRRYMRPDLGINPFPGYMYRSSLIRGVQPDNSEAGKYSDVTFLSRILERGSIIWLADPLMFYRKHGGNDSGALDCRQINRLIHWIVRHSSLQRNDPDIRAYRHWIHLLRLRDLRRAGQPWPRREWRAVFFYFLTHPTLGARIVQQRLTKWLRFR